VSNKDGTFDVIVVGAGVGGAAFALALAHAYSVRVLVLERHPGPGNINRGDSLLPTVTAHLSAWGALERCYTAGAQRLTRMQVFHRHAGLLLDAPLTQPESQYPYLVLPHPEIERTLADTALATGHVFIRYRCHVTQLNEDQGRITGLTFVDEAGHTQQVYARLVVGADGSSSAVRNALGIPLVRVPYNHSFFVVDVGRPSHYEDALRVELHPAGGILIVPGVGGVALAALIRREDEAQFRSWSLEQRIAAIAQRSSLLAGVQAFPKSAHLYQLARAHAPRYTARGAVLLGDAVHLTNPTAGQGMTMAIGDAAALARHVGPALVTEGRSTAIDAALTAYEAERRPVNVGLIRWSHWLSRIYALGGPVSDALHRYVFAFGGSPLGRYLHHTIWTRVAMEKGWAL